MSREFLRALCLATALFAVCASGGRVDGSDPESDNGPDKNHLIELAREFVTAVEIHEGEPENGGAACELSSQPVLVFSDQQRGNPFGTVWIWGTTGRPAAIIEVYVAGGSNYANVMHSLSDQRISGQSEAGWKWQPETAGFVLVPLETTDPVSDRKQVRLIQCRSFARSFTIIQREYYDANESPTQLRLLPQPIHRYADPERGIIDGALFAFVHGETNPEAILVVELSQTDGKAQWQYAFARLGHAEMTATRGGHEVWHVKRLAGLPPETSPYFYIAPARVRIQGR